MSFALLCAMSGPAGADEPLQVLGIHIGMERAAAEQTLRSRAEEDASFERDEAQERRRQDISAQNNIAAPLRYALRDEGALTLEFTPSIQDPKVQSIDYQMSNDPDLAARIERQIMTQFGAPASVYRLAGEQSLKVWEIVAPEQSKDFGPLISIALTTYDADQSPSARLVLSQFNRPLITQTDTGASVQAAPAVTAIGSRPAARRGFGPSD